MVNSQPGGAEVFLQGRKIGLTPFQTNGLPAGQVSLDLMTPTHAGKAVLSIIGGQTTSTNVTLQVRLGAFAIESDPAGAEVWFEGKSLGKTPAHGELPVGQKTLTLKLAGLKDQTAAMLISPTEPSETNVVFAYGAVVINSEPAGAEVRQNEKVLGRTPVTLEGLPPGQYSFQVTANGWQPASLPVEVSDHQTKPVSIKLQKETGLLRLTGNLPGVTASVDGGGAVLLPRDVPVEAGVEHTVTARYKGLEQTIRGLRVNGNQTKVVDEFTFIMEPTRWTNRFSGMVFVKVPGTGLWASANRVTLDQFNKVMAGTPSAAKETEDNGQRYVINLTAGMAKAFATKLNGVNDGAERPAEIKNYHFALPTPGQWMQTFSNAEALGIQITNLRTDREWCLEGNSWHMAGYVLQGTNFYPRPGYKPINPPPGEEPKQLAIRPVLVP